VNAGHNPPLYVGPHGEATFLDGSGGPPAGLFEHVRYQREVCALEPGAVVIMYTDGVVEAENPAGEEFGTDRLVSAVSQVRDRPASEIRARIETELDQFLAGTPPRDDTTFIVVRRPA
jgi:sigma-B regulation protein RsbU (phosphoserine phosphatase)